MPAVGISCSPCLGFPQTTAASRFQAPPGRRVAFLCLHRFLIARGHLARRMGDFPPKRQQLGKGRSAGVEPESRKACAAAILRGSAYPRLSRCLSPVSASIKRAIMRVLVGSTRIRCCSIAVKMTSANARPVAVGRCKASFPAVVFYGTIPTIDALMPRPSAWNPLGLIRPSPASVVASATFRLPRPVAP